MCSFVTREIPGADFHVSFCIREHRNATNGAQNQIHRLRFCFSDSVEFKAKVVIFSRSRVSSWRRCLRSTINALIRQRRRPLETTKMESFGKIVQPLTIVLKLPILVPSNQFYFQWFIKVQSCKLYNKIYMIVSTQILNTEIFAFMTVLVFKLLSCKVLFINRTDNRNC